jgi:hypothetical protein
MNKAKVISGYGVRTNKQRIDEWRWRRKCCMENLFGYPPRLAIFRPDQRHPKLRFSSDFIHGLLAISLWSLIALAIFEGATR